MPHPEPAPPTLGRVSAHLLARLQNEGKKIFTLEEAMKMGRKDYFATGDLLSELVKRKVLARIKSGKYLILPMGSGTTQLKNWPIIARELALPHPYFISHASAMRLHGMSTHPLLEVYVTAPHRLVAREVSDLKYRFLYCKKGYFWGAEERWVTRQEKVRVSDLERTVLDGLDRPDLCGGILEMVRGIWVKHADLSLRKMGDYAQRFRTRAVSKRLGLLLETLNVREDLRAGLLEVLAGSKDYIPLDPTGSKKGRHLKRWRVFLNCGLEELKEAIWA